MLDPRVRRTMAWLLPLAACGDSAPAVDAASLSPDAPVETSDASVEPPDGGGWAPDGAVALPDAAWTPEPCTAVDGVVTLERGRVRLDYDLVTGDATFRQDGVARLSPFYAGVQLDAYLTTHELPTRTCVTTGSETVVTSTGDGLPVLEQRFILDGGNKLLTQLVVKGAGLGTSWIAPVVMSTPGGLELGDAGDPRLLWVPFDNDAWVRYNALPINNSGTSFEVAAFYDNVTRRGVVLGSVSHDTWKTGIYYSGSGNRINALNVFGGATSATWTHDAMPHGRVTGDAIASPLIFVGAGPDWRDLLEEYADANVAVEPRLPWSGGVPFGWNSWGKLMTHLTYDKAVGASNFIRNNLQNASFENGTVYVNLDSYWDNLSDEEQASFVATCLANGQKAGIYWTPFVDWGKNAARIVEGTTTRYEEIWLRDGGGLPIELAGAYAVDPTHPATQARIDFYIDRFRSQGFEYLKLDFLTHGALESSVRWDPNVQTGIQAFNQGMRYVRDRIDGTMFINESIAPLFPYHYAHSRRIACDSFGAAIGDYSAEYELNSVSYGWWMNGRLYAYNDPDSMVFEGFTPSDNMTRLLSAVISGTVFLSGDDLTSPTAQALARAYLTNPRINDVARLGRSFRPVEGNTGSNAVDTFVLLDGAAAYLAVFNFTTEAVSRTVDLARAGRDGTRAYGVTDLWSHDVSSVTGSLTVALPATFARLYRLE